MEKYKFVRHAERIPRMNSVGKRNLFTIGETMYTNYRIHVMIAGEILISEYMYSVYYCAYDKLSTMLERGCTIGWIEYRAPESTSWVRVDTGYHAKNY